MAYQPNLTDEQRANLAKLAAYLRTLPADYPDFEMKDFSADGASPQRVSCGTAACAAGHGPMAGIKPDADETWASYSYNKFVSDRADFSATDPWWWCFGSSWSTVDNTVHGAAARIEFMLANGVPDNAEAQSLGKAPLSYEVAA